MDIPHLSTVSISSHSIYITPISHFNLLHDMISGSLFPTHNGVYVSYDIT